jgi:hypothetical protein
MFAVLRSLFYFTALGFAAVVLIGPVAAVVGTALPFALIGVLVWGLVRGLRRWSGNFRRTAADRRAPLPVLPVAGHPAPRAFPHGVQAARDFGPVRPVRQERVRARGRRFSEMISGALVGALLAWLAVGSVDGTLAAGALAGAALGFVTGRPRQPARELAAAA